MRTAPHDGNFRPAADALVNDAYEVCAQFANESGNARTRSWRIRDFLGCSLPETAVRPLAVDQDTPNPDVLVIDDTNLGFNAKEDLWPLALTDKGNPKSIVYKTSAFPHSLLWKLLLGRFADRMTVVLAVETLRSQSARIECAKSWDQTIEDVVCEFDHGACTAELGRCQRVIVHFGPAGAACLSRVPLHGVPIQPPDSTNDETGLRTGNVKLERLIYRPDELEGAWYGQHPGLTYGVTPLVAAAIARHELARATYPLFIAVSRALGAARKDHEIGGGSGPSFEVSASIPAVEEAYHPRASVERRFIHTDPADEYFSSIPHELLSCPPLRDQPASESDLLRDLTGATDEYVAAKAIEVVMWGPERALDAAPKARYGDYLTVDRDEIERINAIRSLVLAYRDKKEDKKPLSIAVFGPPGSGKSFAVRELARELLGYKQRVLEFNLSQLNTIVDLHHALHEVSDATVRSEMPLVFWDEFDATLNDEKLFWLRHFLEPMQDGSFRLDGVSHPLGKAIFVFAGGTCHNY
ncbi:MAG TPA: ATP-binding protein [bacterium]|nr:ATP-binding protein [bacterium]